MPNYSTGHFRVPSPSSHAFFKPLSAEGRLEFQQTGAMGTHHSRAMTSSPPPPQPMAKAEPPALPARAIAGPSRPSSVTSLPVEVLTLIFHHLPVCDLQMMGETCHDLQRAVRYDATLWAHVELPLQDGRLENEKEGFLCRLLRQRPRDIHTLSLLGARAVRGNCLMAFEPSSTLSPSASSTLLSSLSAAASPSLLCGPSSSFSSLSSSSFSSSRASSSSLRELDLSYCPGLQLDLLERALPALRHSLRSLSLRNTDHLLNDSAVTAILAQLAITTPTTATATNDEPSEAEEVEEIEAAEAAEAIPLNPLQAPGTTALLSLHLGTSTRRNARPGPELTDQTLLAVGARCPLLQSLSVHNQVALTDNGITGLVTALAQHARRTAAAAAAAAAAATAATAEGEEGGRGGGGGGGGRRREEIPFLPQPHLQALDLSLCSSISDRGILSLALHCQQLRRLSLRNCWRITTQAIQVLLARNPSLLSLNLYSCTFVSPDAFDPRRFLVLPPALTPALAAAGIPAYHPPPPPSSFSSSFFSSSSNTSLNPLLSLQEINLSYMRGLHDADLLSLSSLTFHGLREVSVAKCDQLTNEVLVQLCCDCKLEALNVADCLRVDASFVHLLAAAAAAAAAATCEREGDEEGAEVTKSPPSSQASKPAEVFHALPLSLPPSPPPPSPLPTCRPHPLSRLHSLNARHCRGWTDETTVLLLSLQACGAQKLRRLYLGGTALGTGGEGGGEGGREYGDLDGEGGSGGGGGGRGGRGGLRGSWGVGDMVQEEEEEEEEEEEAMVGLGDCCDDEDEEEVIHGRVCASDDQLLVGHVEKEEEGRHEDEEENEHQHDSVAKRRSSSNASSHPFKATPTKKKRKPRGPTDRSVLLLARILGRNLLILDLEGCAGVTDKGVSSLLVACHRLQRLVLSGLPHVGDRVVSELLPSRGRRFVKLPCLVDLHLSSCGNVTPRMAQELKRQRPDIRRLSYRREVTLRGMTSC